MSEILENYFKVEIPKGEQSVTKKVRILPFMVGGIADTFLNVHFHEVRCKDGSIAITVCTNNEIKRRVKNSSGKYQDDVVVNTALQQLPQVPNEGKCAICAVGANLLSKAKSLPYQSQESNALWNEAKQYNTTSKYLCWLIDLDSEDKRPKLWKISKTTFEQLYGNFEADPSIFNLSDGSDITLKFGLEKLASNGKEYASLKTVIVAKKPTDIRSIVTPNEYKWYELYTIKSLEWQFELATTKTKPRSTSNATDLSVDEGVALYNEMAAKFGTKQTEVPQYTNPCIADVQALNSAPPLDNEGVLTKNGEDLPF